jgi:hypothetical protein
MNKQTTIDDLFGQARTTEPYFNDQGFVSRVNAKLPIVRKVSAAQESAISIVAAILGCVVAYQFVSVNELIALIPNKVTLTPITLLASSSLISGLAYWLAEHKRSY